MSDVDPIFQIQADVFAIISSGAFFSDIFLMLNEKGVNKADIIQSLKTLVKKSGKRGATILVDRPIREVPHPDKPGPAYDIIIPVSVYEDATANRGEGGTGKPIEAIISHLCNLVHGRRISDNIGQLYCDEDAVVPVVTPDKFLLSEVNFRTRLQLASPVRVQRPIIAGTADVVQMACNTPGAAIWYTTDESYPWPGNAAATLYSTVFSVTAGTQVRATAWAENQQGSDVATATMNLS